MRILKLLIFALIVCALFYGAYCLIVRPSAGLTGSHDSGGLREMCIGRINAYGDSIYINGWSDEYLTAAEVIVRSHNGRLSAKELQQLETTLQSVFIERTDSLIRSCYGSSMTDGKIVSGSRLSKAYNGLDALAAKYPDVKSSQRWTNLAKLRKAHTDIYNFGQRDFQLSSRINLKTEKSGDRFYISMDDVVNFDNYRASIIKQQSMLESRLNELPELRTSPWAVKALKIAELREKLSTARTNYIDREKRAVESYLGAMVGGIHKEGGLTPENASEIISRLDNIETYLKQRSINAGGFSNVKNQIRRIYIN